MAAALVGRTLLSAFLQVAFDRMASREILDFFQKRNLDETLLKKLNIMLSSINTVIDDAEQKQITHPIVKAWLDELKDAVYESEDILDEIDYEVSKRKLEAEYQTTKVRNSFSAPVIETRMKQVLENLEYLESRRHLLGLKEGGGFGTGLGSMVLKRLPTIPWVDESDICGRDGDKEMIVEWLLSDNDNGNCVSVVSIVGMGGLGKTTLAQLVYNDQRMKNEFDLKAWVCVSDEFDTMRVTRTIVRAMYESIDDTEDLNILQIKLKEILTGKRFLLVLDDLWNENYVQWDALQIPFNHGASGSKILVTTRSHKVASIVGSTKIHLFKQLTEEDSWRLFSRYAFGNREPPSDFEKIGREIIKKCDGLPLALKIIGSLLYPMSSLQEWSMVLMSETWQLDSNMLEALQLSYHYLPSSAKRCFAYCSLFPKGYEFDKKELVQLWMAENFLQYAQHSKDIREVGDEIFHDLLSRSFFQQSSGDKKRFVMHDLINDLAKHVSREFCFMLEAEEAHDVSTRTRHFSYLRKSLEVSKRFKAIYVANRLRTFLPFSVARIDDFSVAPIDERYCNMSSMMIHDLLSKLCCLRVLSLSGYLNIIELPDSIGNLKHLRYLDLSATGVKKLPDSICLLYNLQTLKLRYCKSLEKLPSDMYKIINLCYLDFRETKVRDMPKQLGKLKNLQVLSSFYVGSDSLTNIGQLEELNLLGTLSVSELQNVVSPVDALAAKLKNKVYLKQLKLEWSMKNVNPRNERDVLEELQPHQNLKKLSIINYGGLKFPIWFADNTLSNVVSLKLINCKNCFFLPSLGHLPSLKSLSIIGFNRLENIDLDFYGNSSCTTPFGSLEILRFQDLRKWEEWECEDVLGAFPCLQELYIEKCPRLKEHLPPQLPSLRKLVIDECEQLVALVQRAPVIQELVLENSGNLQLEYLPSNLKHLVIFNCPKLIASRMELDLHSHTSLQHLHIGGTDVECLPDAGLLPPTLPSLCFSKCSNLKTLDYEGLWHLSALKQLTLMDCPQFQSLPKEGLPKSLSTLQIIGCPLLREQCQKHKGKDWEKIAHIPCIKIDGEIIT